MEAATERAPRALKDRARRGAHLMAAASPEIGAAPLQLMMGNACGALRPPVKDGVAYAKAIIGF